MAWADSNVKVNNLPVTGKGKFDPRVPIEQPDEEGDDVLICTDVSEACIEGEASG